MEGFYTMIAGAVVVETLLEIVKGFIREDKKPNWNLIVGAAAGIIVCISCNIDIFVPLNIECHVPYLGMVIAGFIISRGSNLVHDLLKKINDATHVNDDE